jgi:precorrin-2 dehydrogenase / sirohydrochlorin ferrochelatase
MLPLTLDLSRLRLILVGTSSAAVRRLQLLEEAGAREVAVYSDAPSSELASAAATRLVRRWPVTADLVRAQLVFIADVPEPTRTGLIATARAGGALVHVEDAPELSDAHAPAVLRRGDLVIAVSTGGASPALAVQVRRFLARLFGSEWGGRVAEIAAQRRVWRAAGADHAALVQRTEDWIADRRWLALDSAPTPARMVANDVATQD